MEEKGELSRDSLFAKFGLIYCHDFPVIDVEQDSLSVLLDQALDYELTWSLDVSAQYDGVVYAKSPVACRIAVALLNDCMSARG